MYKNSELGDAIERNLINMLPPSTIKDTVNKLYPYVVVAGDVIQLKPHMLKPFARLDSCSICELFVKGCLDCSFYPLRNFPANEIVFSCVKPLYCTFKFKAK